MTGYLLFGCAVCAGDPSEASTKGLLLGVWLLLGVITLVLGGIAATAASWARRARRLSAAAGE